MIKCNQSFTDVLFAFTVIVVQSVGNLRSTIYILVKVPKQKWRMHSIKMDFDLYYRKSSQTYKISHKLQCTNRVEINVVITADMNIDFHDANLIGKDAKSNYITFSDIDFVLPIRLKPKQRDIITIIMRDKSFREIDQCEALYLTIKSYNCESAREVVGYYEMLSSDWLNEKWIIRHITLNDIYDVRAFQQKIVEQKRSKINAIYAVPNELISQYTFLPSEDLKNMNTNMASIRIVESKLGELVDDTQCFLFLVELTNISNEDYSYKVSGISLLDSENVNLTLVGYIDSMSPTECAIESGTKDRFYIGFKTNKTKNIDSELLLKFYVTISGYKEAIEEKIHFEHIAGKWQEVGHSIKEEKQSAEKQKETRALKILEEKLNAAMYKFGVLEGLTFNKVTVDYHEDKLRVRALVKNNSKRNICFFSVVIFDANDKIVATLSDTSDDEKWKLIDMQCYDFPLYQCDNVEIVKR